MSGGEGLRARLSGRLGSFSLDVAFEAAAGSVTALVGPSGSGKSTILRALAGLERLDGEVAVNGEVWQADGRFLAPHRRAVGYVFQHAALLPHLTVRGNLAYAARRSGESLARLVETAARLGLSALLERLPDRLSGGERRRVALARALLTRPRLLLLDEPLSGLDAAAKAELVPELARVIGGLGIPILYVSHDADEVARLNARVLGLEAGRLRAETSGAADRDPLAGFSPEGIRQLARAALAAGLDSDG